MEPPSQASLSNTRADSNMEAQATLPDANLIESLASAMHRLTLSSQVSPQAATPVAPSCASSQFYSATLRGIKFPTYNGARKQEEVNDFLNLFTVAKGLNNLTDPDLVRIAVQHLRGDALLWWIELADTNRTEALLSDWNSFKQALRQQFVQWNVVSTETQKLIFGLRQTTSARNYFTQLRHTRTRSHSIPNAILFNIVYFNVKPHCRAALIRLQQLRSTDDLPLEEIEEACIREDETELARGYSSRKDSSNTRLQRTTTSQRPCPICGEAHFWRDCERKAPSGCPSCGGTCTSIHTCPRSFASTQRAGFKNSLGFSRTSNNKPIPTSPNFKTKRAHNTTTASISTTQVDNLAIASRPTLGAQVIKTNSLINNPKQLVFQGKINKHPITFLLDGGADHSIISRTFAVNAGIIMHPLDHPISTTFANSTSEPITLATEQLELECQGHRSSLQPLVSKNASFDLLVGLDWLSRYNPRIDWDSGSLMLSDGDCCYKWQAHYSDAEFQDENIAIRLCTARQLRTYPSANENYATYVATLQKAGPEEGTLHSPSAEVKQLLQEFPQILEDPSTLPPERCHQHSIPLCLGAQPTRKSPYRLQPRELEHLQSCIQQWLANGWIRPSCSSWASPVFFVSKKNGELRLVVDYRGLNAQTQPDKFPLPLIDVLIDKMSGSKVFTRLDLRNGFYQIRMKEDDIYKTSFTSSAGLYEWTVMPMGLINAPASFQRVMTEVFRDFSFVEAYMDDIVVHSPSNVAHHQHLRQVFRRLSENRFHLNLSKCTFEANSIEFLGFQLSASGVLPLPANVESINAMPDSLTSRTQVRRFLGMANYYSHFVPHFASIATPLHRLTSSTLPFIWDLSCSRAVQHLKHLLTNAPVLAIFDPQLPTRLTSDASAVGIGAVLEQQHPDGWHPVHFLSRTLGCAEKNYPVTDKEWLAVIYALTKWRHYLQRHFTIRTDHKPLVSLLSKSSADLHDRRARWMSLLLRFSYSIEHLSGKNNVVADLLSRLPDCSEPITSIACAASTTDPTASPSTTPYALALTSPHTHARESLRTDILRYRDGDAQYMKIYNRLSSPPANERFSLREGLLYYDTQRLVIPKYPLLRTRLIAEHHDSAYAGHMGRDRTTAFLSRGFYWPSLTQDVEEYIKTCDACMRNKTTRHPTTISPIPINAPSRWHTVCLDVLGPFATNSPVEPGSDTCVLVFMDKLTKMLRLAACPQQLSAEKAASLFIEHVFRHHGIPERLLSDQGPQFTSSFWKHVFTALQTKVVNTTPYYPQGNGQVERTNRTITEGLRSFINHRKDDWQQYLHLFEFAYNNTVHATTKTTPFFLNYGRHPTTVASLLNPQLPPDLYNKDAAVFLDKLHSAISLAHQYINSANEKTASRPGADTQTPFAFNLGDFVLLPSRCFRATRKLDAPYVGPFRLIRKVTSLTFELEGLPAGCSKVWNLRHFKPYYLSSEKHQAYRQAHPLPISAAEPDVYEVDRIDDCWQKRDGLYYLVQWKGYANPTWEPLKNLSGCAESIQDFHRRVPLNEAVHSVAPRDRHRLAGRKRASSTTKTTPKTARKRIRTSHFSLRLPLF